MNQSRIDSALEAVTNILIGASVALLSQLIWFPMIGKSFTLTENLMTTVFFTFISLIRSYTIRRIFNGISICQWIKTCAKYMRREK